MAITLVGSGTGTHFATAGQAYAFSGLRNSANVAPTLQQSDLVLVVTEIAGTVNLADGTMTPTTPTGYTGLFNPNLGANDTHRANMQVSWKFMGATPDTSVTIRGVPATTNSCAYLVFVLRGVDLTTPFDGVTPQGAASNNTGVPNAPGITPATVGAWILCFGGSAMAAGTAPSTTPPTGMDAGTGATLNHFRTAIITTQTNDAGVAGGIKSNWTADLYDPAAFGGFNTTNTGSWTAASLVLRPAPEPPTLNALTGSLSVNENTAVGTVVGTPTGYTEGSSKSFASNPGNYFAINATTGQITRSATALDRETAGATISVQITETLAGATNTPRTTTLVITINDLAAPAATVWNPNTTPSISAGVPIDTIVGYLNKTIGNILEITGGTNSGQFYLDSFDPGGDWRIMTAVGPPLTAGTSTLQIHDTSNGPAGSGEDRTDTLSITVTSAAVNGNATGALGGAITVSTFGSEDYGDTYRAYGGSGIIPAFYAPGATSQANTTASHTVTLDESDFGNYVAGHPAYLLTFIRATTATIPTAPTGWTLETGFPLTLDTGYLYVFKRLAVTGDPNPVIAFSGGTSGNTSFSIIYTMVNGDINTPISIGTISNNAASSTQYLFPNDSPVVPNGGVILALAKRSDNVGTEAFIDEPPTGVTSGPVWREAVDSSSFVGDDLAVEGRIGVNWTGANYQTGTGGAIPIYQFGSPTSVANSTVYLVFTPSSGAVNGNASGALGGVITVTALGGGATGTTVIHGNATGALGRPITVTALAGGATAITYIYKGASNRAGVYRGSQAPPLPYKGAKGLFPS